jgi:hypothetical protein
MEDVYERDTTDAENRVRANRCSSHCLASFSLMATMPYNMHVVWSVGAVDAASDMSYIFSRKRLHLLFFI